MNDIEKINEELRNFKLYKIQRANTRRQEFEEVKVEIQKTNKDQLFNYFMVLVHFTSILYLVKSFLYDDSKDTNSVILGVNILIVFASSLYVLYQLVRYIKNLKKQLKTVENGIQYFSTEIEVLKSDYEIYVGDYLQRKQKV